MHVNMHTSPEYRLQNRRGRESPVCPRGSRHMSIAAVQHVRRMRGGAQSHLMRCADGHYYVVKFQNNPQHPRVLINDWIGTRLAEMIGLPVPATAIVDVDEQLIKRTAELRVQIGPMERMFTPGPSFGSRYLVSPFEGQVYDYFPEAMMRNIRNLQDFAGILAFDKWTCNADGRQAAFWKQRRERKFTASFIDQGYCFNAGEWSFPDAPLRGVFGRNDVYACVTSWEDFEPWLGRIEAFPASSLWRLLDEIPREWFRGSIEELERLITRLLIRRSRVRELILEFKNSSRNPFPNWREGNHVGPA
jgi:hypothetical protein